MRGEKMKAEIKALLEKKQWKGKDLMIVIVIIGVLFAVLAIPTAGDKEEDMATEVHTDTSIYDSGDYQEELEKRLEEILSKMDGVGKVKVMITLEASSKEVVEKDWSTSQSTNQNDMEIQTGTSVSKEETTVYADTNAGNIPYVIQEIYPEVEGVLVVAEGGDNSYVNLAITDAIQALFGIDVHKIKIVKMNMN